MQTSRILGTAVAGGLMLGLLGAAATPTSMTNRAEEPWRGHYDAQAEAQMRADYAMGERFHVNEARPIDLSPGENVPTWKRDEEDAIELAVAKIHEIEDLPVPASFEPLGLSEIERSKPQPLPARASAAPQPETAPADPVEPMPAAQPEPQGEARVASASLRPSLGTRLALTKAAVEQPRQTADTAGIY